ncbi:MAG: L,D-transpeptidase [bacterium]|nr:L,D-transpeptidase [bacterium]
MKSHFIVISFFLLAIGILVGGAKALQLHQQITLASAEISSTNELLSEAYVEQNILPQDGLFKEGETSYTFNNVTKAAPVDTLRTIAYKAPSNLAVLGASTEPRKIVIDLEHQRVYAYEGSRVALNFLVSTGKYGATPVGKYKIWYKVRSQTMKGGNRALGTYYYLPNVQFIQYFNQGIGFHSTYWHNNYGTPMSHGCVNMTLTDAETLYYWANPEMPNGVKIFRPTGTNPGTEVEVVSTWNV